MKILGSDFRKGFCRLKVDNLDDLWVLSQVIEPGDLVKSRTLRKIKLGKEGDRKSNVVKKPVTLTITVEKVEFHKYSNSLRVSGLIKEGPDDIPHGSHHTIDVNENTSLTINKEWLGFQIDKIKDAASDKVSQVLICVMDRDEACFALIKKYGYDYLSDLTGAVQKKGMEETFKEKGFYNQVIAVLEDYVQRYNIEVIVLASPAFWKDDLMKVLKQKSPDLTSKIVLSTCNATGKNGINEVLKRPEIRSALKQERVVKESALVEDLLIEISKNNLAVYGLKQTKSAAESGAINILLVTDKLIQELRDKDQYNKLDSIMKLVDQTKGKIVIISNEHDAGKKLHGLGGIGGILRYKLSY